MGSLKDRMHEALRLSGKTQTDLAKACGVKPPSVNDWMSGKTKSLKAATAHRAAAFLGVNMLWLTEGRGQMSDVAAQDVAHEESEPAFEISDEEARWVLLMRRVLSEPRSRLIHLIEEEAERSDRIRREVLGDAGSTGDYEGAQSAEDRRKKDRRSSVGWSYFSPEQGQGESVPAKRSAK